MDLSVGAPMTLWRAVRVAAILVLSLTWLGCGDTFRPVAVPISPPPPDPSSFHFVLVINGNGFGITGSGPLPANNPGSSTRIDVSGDTNIGVAKVGLGPAHAKLTPSGSRVYVANSLDDTVSSYAPSNATFVTTTSLPTGSVPVFVDTTENGTVYVANPGNNTIAAISTVTNVVTNNGIIVLSFSPIVLAETPDAKKVYAVGGSAGAVSINTIDKTVNPLIADSSLASPVWVVIRSDSQRAYVLNQGSGKVTVIDTSSDGVLGSVSVGSGANFMLYDKTRNRLYVTNPTANTVTALDASVDPPGPASPPNPPLFVASVPANPVSVAALPDGSRIYVASVVASSGSVTSLVTVINASDGSIRSTIPLGPVPIDSVNPTGCGTPNPSFSQLFARFRVSIAASEDSSRVYLANCDAGNTSIIRTFDDTQVLNLPAPLSDFPPATTTVQITAASQSGSNTTNTYSLVSGPALRVGTSIAITGMGDTANNGIFTIVAVGTGTFTVANGSGVTANGQSGIGTVTTPPPQNPVFVLSGP